MVEGFATDLAPADWQLEVGRALTLVQHDRIVICQSYPDANDVQLVPGDGDTLPVMGNRLRSSLLGHPAPSKWVRLRSSMVESLDRYPDGDPVGVSGEIAADMGDAVVREGEVDIAAVDVTAGRLVPGDDPGGVLDYGGGHRFRSSRYPRRDCFVAPPPAMTQRKSWPQPALAI